MPRKPNGQRCNEHSDCTVHQCFAPEVDADPVVSWKLVKGAMRMQTVIRSLVTELVLKRMRKVRWLTYEDTKMPMILSWSSE